MNSKLFRTFSLVLTILLVCGFIGAFYVLVCGGLTNVDYLVFFIQAVVSLFAIFYLQSGFKKETGNVYYKAYMLSLAVLVFVSMIQAKTISTASLLLMVLQFGALCILSVGTDMGVKVSSALAWVLFGCAVALFPAAIVAGGLNSIAVLRLGVLTVLSLCALIMVYAKYADKKARGTR